MRPVLFLSIVFFCVCLGLVVAEPMTDDLPITMRFTDIAGTTEMGPWNLTFNLSRNEACTDVVFSESRLNQSPNITGILSIYLHNIPLNFTDTYFLCVYQNQTYLNGPYNVTRTSSAFSAKYVNASGILDEGNLNISTHTLSVWNLSIGNFWVTEQNVTVWLAMVMNFTQGNLSFFHNDMNLTNATEVRWLVNDTMGTNTTPGAGGVNFTHLSNFTNNQNYTRNNSPINLTPYNLNAKYIYLDNDTATQSVLWFTSWGVNRGSWFWNNVTGTYSLGTYDELGAWTGYAWWLRQDNKIMRVYGNQFLGGNLTMPNGTISARNATFNETWVDNLTIHGQPYNVSTQAIVNDTLGTNSSSSLWTRNATPNYTVDALQPINHSYHTNTDNRSALLFAITGNGTTGTQMPHFWVQNGGAGQASGVSRSFMIVNENARLQNDLNITSCLDFAHSAGKPLLIDCNTTTTGADLLVGDGMQVFGDIYAPDTSGEYHYLTRDITWIDNMASNTVRSPVNGTLGIGTLSIAEANNIPITTVINNNLSIMPNQTDKSVVTTGTNTTPTMNYIYYENNPPGYPSLRVYNAAPTTYVPWIAQILAGWKDAGRMNVYGSVISSASAENFVGNVYMRFYNQGLLYDSGFAPKVGAQDASFGSGTFISMLRTITVAQSLNITDNTTFGFYNIRNDGTYRQYVSFGNISQYSDGGAIANNKYFNVVFGLVLTEGWQTSAGTALNARVMSLVQTTPSGGEYTTALAAETDQYHATIYTPTNTFLKKNFLPLVRVIIKRDTGAEAQAQLLASGTRYQDLRGMTTGTTSGSASSGTSVEAVNAQLVNYTSVTNLTAGKDIYNLTNGTWHSTPWSNVTNRTNVSFTILNSSNVTAIDFNVTNNATIRDLNVSRFNGPIPYSNLSGNMLNVTGGLNTSLLNVTNLTMGGDGTQVVHIEVYYNASCKIEVVNHTTRIETCG